MARDQAVIRDAGTQVVNVVIRHIGGEPVHQRGRTGNWCAMPRYAIPAFVLTGVGMLEIVLNRKQHDPAAPDSDMLTM